ncbi:MAG: hypothetical protein ACD_79C01118G0002 [uncultured bacterium]|nr:MAG: hypothetical protein ACD_79C01118G0002 [uncultured bacterium]
MFQTDHIKMLCDIGELTELFIGSKDIEAFFQKIVLLVADHMHAEVCSIYVYDENNEELILKSTKGLNQDCVNRLKLKIGEGLVGLCLKELRTISEKNGKENPNFKFIPGIFEEKYDSFLAVPIFRGQTKLGVLVVQKLSGNYFSTQDKMAMRATASQLVAIIENTKILFSSHQKAPKQKKCLLETLKFVKGAVASEGYAYEDAIVLNNNYINKDLLSNSYEKNLTLSDLEESIINTEEQLKDLQKKVEEKLSDAASMIFTAHLLMLKDSEFIGSIKNLIAQGEHPVKAIMKISKKYEHIFLKNPNPVFKEKAKDIQDLTTRIINNLTKNELELKKYNNHIIIAKEILPSELLRLSVENVKGIILVSGGVTSHVAILSRSLSIPLIIADVPEFLEITEKIKILMDADIGNIYINPSKDIISNFEQRNNAKKALDIIEEKHSLGKVLTKDNNEIKLMVNINLLSDINLFKNIEVDGIGLYRTEFPFLIRNNFPSEEEQYIIYKKLCSSFLNKPITFRTLDIGGDKVLSYFNNPKENNPFLGMRSIRFTLSHIDVFKQQIRAILRAAIDSEIRIMFPMISSIDDFTEAKKIVENCISELKSEGTSFNDHPEIGLMVEIPSAVSMIEELAAEADFLSIGTNDLVQYTLAVDRTNEKVSHLYISHHPAILKSLKRIADAALSNKIDVSICGDMANETKYLPFLLGIGINSLSVDPIYISKIRKTIPEIELREAKKQAEILLSQSKIKDIEDILQIKKH